MANAKTSNVNPIARAWILSLAGFIPFAGLSVFIFINNETHPMFSLSVDMFKIWSAIILSFLGGIRWGVAITGVPSDEEFTEGQYPRGAYQLLSSVVPSIFALFALLLPSIQCVIVLMICFCIQGIWDSFSSMNGQLPKWMGSIRITLTVLVVAAHAAVLLALA